MQNNHSVLPFDKTKIKKVLVAGKLAKTENIGDHGSSQVRPKYIVTPLEGLIS
jgi:beta-glucosidase